MSYFNTAYYSKTNTARGACSNKNFLYEKVNSGHWKPQLLSIMRLYIYLAKH